MNHKIGIYIYDDMEVLDFAGPFEVFSVAGRLLARAAPEAGNGFEVFTIADKMRLIQARGNLRVQPHYAWADHPAPDVLIVPGGVVDAELQRPEVIQWIAQTARTTQITASVCTGAFLLAKAGMLKGKTATTHWEDIPDLQNMFPDTTVQSNSRWVDLGAIVTAAGISAGIDMSLHLVGRLKGEALANKTARQMEFERRKIDNREEVF